MKGAGFLAASLAIAAGVSAQALAARLAIPSIVLLLAAGVVLGPDGLGWLDPAVFGAAQGDLLGLAVTVILFEGALGLDLDRLREHRRTLVALLFAGGAISMAVGTLAAALLLDVPWSVALLYGALMIVTGPTVVTPLVRRLPVARHVREVLVSEGVLIDPLGAIVALVVAEAVVGHDGAANPVVQVVARLGTGAAIGTGVGVAVGALLRRQWLSEHVTNPFVLASALLASAVASHLSPEAGLMAAVAQGLVLANRGIRSLGRVREFKEALTVVLLGFVFVMLTAGVRLTEVLSLGWRGLAVVAALVWIGRPLGVLVATWGSAFTAGERAFLAWICPRGVVAAAVAGLFHVFLDDAGMPGGARLEALVFLTVAVTVTWQGLTARTAARLFGADLRVPLGVVIVGADELGRLLARTLAAGGRQVVLVDQSPWACQAAHREHLAVYEGDALSLDALDEAGVRHAALVVALTRNLELNALVAQRVHDNYAVEQVLAVVQPNGGPPEHALFPGHFPGVDAANALLRAQRLVASPDVAPDGWAGRTLGEIDHPPDTFALAVERGDAISIATTDFRLTAGDRIHRVGPEPAAG